MNVLATIATVGLIAALFYLDRDRGRRTSLALWIPVLWLMIVASRPVSMWLQVHRDVTLAEQYTESSPIDATYYGLLIVAALFALNTRWARVRGFLESNLAILLYFAYCAVSVAWSDNPMMAFKRWAKALGEFAIVLVVLTDPEPRLALTRFLTRVGFVLIPLSMLFVYFYPSLGTNFDPSSHTLMFIGVCTFKNELGLLCLVAGLASLWQFLRALHDRALESRWKYLAAHGTIVAMATWLIVKADSMTSLACFGLAGMVMVFSALKYVEHSRGALPALFAGALSLALFAVFIDSAGILLHALGRNATLTGRTQIWAAVLAQPIHPLVGTGFESFWAGNRMQAVWDLSQNGIEEAHNGYLEMYLNLGWIGVALLIVLLVTGYRSAMAIFRVDPHEGRLRVSFLAAAAIYSLTEAGFRMMSPIWIAFLLAITAVPAPRAVEAHSRRSVWSRNAARKPMRILQ